MKSLGSLQPRLIQSMLLPSTVRRGFRFVHIPTAGALIFWEFRCCQSFDVFTHDVIPSVASATVVSPGGYVGAGHQPQDHHKCREEQCPEERPQLYGAEPSRFDAEAVQRCGLEGVDVIDVAFADLGSSVRLVFVDNVVQTPAGQSADHGDNAAGAVLAVIAMNHEGILLAVENHSKDGSHGSDGDSFLFGASHVKDHLIDAIAGDEGLKIMIDLVLLDQGSMRSISFGTMMEHMRIAYTTVLSFRPCKKP